jgi:hypothetical protein
MAKVSAQTAGPPKQFVGPERRERVSHQNWCGEGCVNSRRPVNSDVSLFLPIENYSGATFSIDEEEEA